MPNYQAIAEKLAIKIANLEMENANLQVQLETAQAKLNKENKTTDKK